MSKMKQNLDDSIELADIDFDQLDAELQTVLKELMNLQPPTPAGTVRIRATKPIEEAAETVLVRMGRSVKAALIINPNSDKTPQKD